MDTSRRWEKVGKCAVDSGTLIVVDPCYVDGDKPVDMDTLVGPYATESDQEPRELIATPTGPGALFVRLSNFGGDGIFPVYVQRDAGGAVVAAMIRFSRGVAIRDVLGS